MTLKKIYIDPMKFDVYSKIHITIQKRTTAFYPVYNALKINVIDIEAVRVVASNKLYLQDYE